MNNLDLDAKLEADSIVSRDEGALLYFRHEGNEVTHVYAGTDEDIVFMIMSAMATEKSGVLYDLISTAVAVYEEQYGEHTEQIDS